MHVCGHISPRLVNNFLGCILLSIRMNHPQKVKVSFYIAQYPLPGTAQSALHFTSLADLFNRTLSRLLLEASNHGAPSHSWKHPATKAIRTQISTTIYSQVSFIQLSELEQRRVKKLAQCFTRQHRIRSRRESEVLPLSHCATFSCKLPASSVSYLYYNI